MLSIFFYGYLFSFVGGYLGTKIGGVTVYGLGIMMTAILTVLSPFAIRTNLYLFAAGRFAEGLFEVILIIVLNRDVKILLKVLVLHCEKYILDFLIV